MVHDARLRKALVTKRAHTAAAAGAVVLALTASQSAGAARPAWSKAWAEQQLRKHFDADSAVCLPIGRATRRKHEPATFKEFVCVLVTRDGTRYTIHLRPRSRTAWTTLSSERRGREQGRVPASGQKKERSDAGHPPRSA